VRRKVARSTVVEYNYYEGPWVVGP
jgi:hypothetical protein